MLLLTRKFINRLIPYNVAIQKNFLNIPKFRIGKLTKYPSTVVCRGSMTNQEVYQYAHPSDIGETQKIFLYTQFPDLGIF